MSITGIKMKSIALTKRRIRSKILLELKRQKEEDQERKSKVIKGKLFRTRVFKHAKTVMFYVSFDGEVKTKGMIEEAQNLGKVIAVPVCQKNKMIKPCLLNEEAKLVRGPYGIWEPASKRGLALKDIDLIIVPGLAFDRWGSRLGRGKGYYDRFLKRLVPKTKSIGLAFDFQILPNIPTTERDVNVQRIITN
jgi:5-formyltetrahydrofolate cyclo-ligase